MTCDCKCVKPAKYEGNQSDGDGGGFVASTPWALRYANQTGMAVTFRSADKKADDLGKVITLGKQTKATLPCTPLQPGADPKTKILKAKDVTTTVDLMANLERENTSAVIGGGPPAVQVFSKPAQSLAPVNLSAGIQPVAQPTGGQYIF